MTAVDRENDRRARDIREQQASYHTMQNDPKAIFTFGSNRKGIHGGGAAYTAHTLYGAVMGQGEGLQGRSYGIPTKVSPTAWMGLEDIAVHVATFIEVARERDDLTFVVTRVGCGLAGHVESDIAPMFKDAPPNCLLPEGWR